MNCGLQFNDSWDSPTSCRRTPCAARFSYAHAPAAVWNALTDPELHAQWWAAGDVRPVVGHKFHLDMGKWGRQPCEVLEVQPERLLKYRFATGVLDTVITWHLIPEGSGTRLTLIHEGFNLDSPLGRLTPANMQGGAAWNATLHGVPGSLTQGMTRSQLNGPKVVAVAG